MSTKLRILYAEDEALLREVTTELLIGEGYDCTSVQDGLEAKLHLQNHEFDLLITDFKMPKMDGAQLLYWMRESGIHIPVIFVSGNLERAPAEDMALGDCCCSLLTKPISLDVLVKEITTTTNRKHEFDCHTETQQSQNKNTFPGQHFLKSEFTIKG